MSQCHIIPPYLLERIASGHHAARAGDGSQHTLRIDEHLRSRRTTARPSPTGTPEGPFSIHTAGNGSDLPGSLVRAAGQPESGDVAVDEAYVGVEGSLALFSEVFGRSSYDGEGAPVVATVHYERDYDNAFWDGSQLVFGDGDGEVFDRFTKPVDVLGHELSHAVVQFTADLTYQGQSGALNESIADVFGSCLKQRLLGQTADQADWLIGEGIFLPPVNGRALRSMAAPGTAYDDPAIGKDPQVASMDEYVDTDEDNGGVHLNSGIPNKAFHLAATGLGGNSWDGAGTIWYAALTSGLGAGTDFAGFAAATLAAAAQVSATAADVVRDAWTQVGVAVPAAGGSPAPGSDGSDAGGSGAGAGTDGSDRARVVAVTRSGGFGGTRRTGEVVLGDDPRTPEVESLIERIDFRGISGSRPQPDRFVYTFDVEEERVVVGEQDLTPDLDRLTRLLLDS